MSCLLPVLVVVGVMGGLWWWSHRRLVEQRRRLEAMLEWWTSGGTPGRAEFLERGYLSPLALPLERVGDELTRLRHDIQQESYNLRTILESMEEGVMIVDHKHVLRLVNPSFRGLFHLQRDPVGLTVLHTLRETAVEEMVERTLQTAEPQNVEFSRNVEKRIRHFAGNAVPMRDTAGRPGVLTIFRDISRLKQLEEVRREFVANVSHELRTPLSIFHGYVETLMENPEFSREETVDVLLIMQRHSLRLNALLEDLLVLARLESRHERPQVEPIPLQEFLQRIVRDWESKAAAREVSLVTKVEPDLPPLPADPLRLEQVLSNLFENAMKYTPAGGRILVRVRLEGEWFVLRVEDTGAGILPGDLPHIFERFYRADKARTRERGGTGLGLSIVKHIVQLHGGTVAAESTFGNGTAIVLRFPLHAPETAHEGEGNGQAASLAAT